MFRFELGILARDVITEAEGTIVARIEYLNGCRQYSLQRRIADGKVPEPVWVDEQQLVVAGQAVAPVNAIPGGPHPTPPGLPHP
jgi:hypothetical protein